MFGTSGCSTSRATACISIASRKLGPERAWPLRHSGASMCTNGSGTNSVKPPVCSCRSRTCSRWRAQCRGDSTWPNMMVAVLRRPTRCAARITSSHCCVLTLSGQMIARTSSQRISAAVPGSVRRPASRSCAEEGLQPDPERAGAVGDLERRERMHVDVRRGTPRGLHDRQVGVAGVARVDAALQAHFRRPARLRLRHALADLGEVEVVAGAAQRARAAALGERAEPAGIGADVRVVDVAIDDVGDGVAVDRGPQRVGRRHHAREILAVGAEQPLDLGLRPGASRGSRDRARHRVACSPAPRAAAAAAGRCRDRVRPPDQRGVARQRRGARPGGPLRLAHVTAAVGATQHRGLQGGRQPAPRLARVGRHDREPFHQPAPGRARALLERRRSPATAPRGSRGRASPARRRPSR